MIIIITITIIKIFRQVIFERFNVAVLTSLVSDMDMPCNSVTVCIKTVMVMTFISSRIV